MNRQNTYKGYKIIEEQKPINHKYDIRTIYKIKTNKWFNSIIFMSLSSLYKFINKECLK